MNNNLPSQVRQDSAAATRLFFDTYGDTPLEFSANEVDTSIAFFTEQGFVLDAARIIAMTLLKQARREATPIFAILDTLKTLSGAQLNETVARVLNNNRVSSSTLGFKTSLLVPELIKRNIRA